MMDRDEFTSKFADLATRMSNIPADAPDLIQQAQAVSADLSQLLVGAKYLVLADACENIRQQFIKISDVRKELDISAPDFFQFTPDRFLIYQMQQLVDQLETGYLQILEQATKRGIQI